MVAGWIAGELWQDYGFGLIGNLIVGIIGAVLGWVIIGRLIDMPHGSIIGTLVTSVIGAIALLLPVNIFAHSTPDVGQ